MRSELALRCLDCGGELTSNQAAFACGACGASWPVDDGIPRFFESEYWGEVPREDVVAMTIEARTRGWEAAVYAAFHTSFRREYCLDLQRASWLALLDLPPGAVGLDIGSGFGAITHSLALSLEKVYSVEAVKERIEFTHERLRQAGAGNVTLIQASALELPFFPGSFDLIVCNGVLEWIGDWDPRGRPRGAQLRFLRGLESMLRPGGRLVIGIENRIGREAFHGGLDHSGRPYTSLMPRCLATAVLSRRGKSGEYVLHAPGAMRKYRTYTYSASGYRRLLREAGLPRVTVYWPANGYNRPHCLAPIDCVPLQVEHRERDWPIAPPRPWWYRRAKMVRNRLSPIFADAFVMVGAKGETRRGELEGWLRKRLAEVNPAFAGEATGSKLRVGLLSNAFHSKNLLSFWSPRAGLWRAVAAVSVRADQPGGGLEAGYRNLVAIHTRLAKQPGSGFRVPQPLGFVRFGKTECAVMSRAGGVPFRRLARPEVYAGETEAIRRDFIRLVELAAGVAESLRPLPESWTGRDGNRCSRPLPDAAIGRGLPALVADEPRLAREVSQVRYFRDDEAAAQPAWVQHGDFDLGNIFFDAATDRFEVIDWDDLAGGLPPLYDVFTLLAQADLAYLRYGAVAGESDDERRFRSFARAFLQPGETAELTRELLFGACARLGIPGELLPSLFTEFLLHRIHFNAMRGESRGAKLYLRMLRAWFELAEPSPVLACAT